jgi:hypothetical protein
MTKQNTTPKIEAKAAEHMIETFPEPQGMPAEWHEHDVATAKYRLKKQAEKAAKIAEAKVEFSDDDEKAAHMIEKFPSLKIEPKEWHCTHCDDDKE